VKHRPLAHSVLWTDGDYDAGVAHLLNCWDRGLWRSIESPGDYAILADHLREREKPGIVSPFAVLGPTPVPPDEDRESARTGRNACFIGAAAFMEIFAEWHRLGLVPAEGPKLISEDWPAIKMPVHPTLGQWARDPAEEPLEWIKSPVSMLYLTLLLRGWWVPIIEPCDVSDPAAVLEEKLAPVVGQGRTGKVVGLGQAQSRGDRTNRYAREIHQLVGISWRPEVGQQTLRDVILAFALGPMVAYYVFAQADTTAKLDQLLAVRPKTFGTVVNTATTDIPLEQFHTWAGNLADAWQTRIYVPEPDEPRDEFASDPALVKALAKLPDVVIHDRTVENFLTLQTEMGLAATRGNQDAIDAATCCRDARVIQFRPEIVDRVIGEVSSYIDTLAERHKEPGESDQAKYERVHEMASTIPFPDPVPFENMFFGWGDSIPASVGVRILVSRLVVKDENVDALQWTRHKDGFIACYVLGILVTSRDDGSAWLVIENKARDCRMLIGMVRNGKWLIPSANHGPWLLAWFVSAINAHSALTLETSHRLRRQRHLHRFAKAVGKRPIPRPYYTVVLTPGMMKVRRTVVNAMPREWRHRWDVLGHFVRRIERGPLPLSEREIRDLTQRQYRIFTRLNMPDPDALEALMWRQESPPGDGEWVAVQKIWRGAYIKGPKDKPYIPSVHQLGRKKKRGRRAS